MEGSILDWYNDMKAHDFASANGTDNQSDDPNVHYKQKLDELSDRYKRVPKKLKKWKWDASKRIATQNRIRRVEAKPIAIDKKKRDDIIKRVLDVVGIQPKISKETVDKARNEYKEELDREWGELD